MRASYSRTRMRSRNLSLEQSSQLLERQKFFNKLSRIVEDETITIVESDECATGYGIHTTLKELLAEDVHLIDPKITAIHTPASNDEANAKERAINLGKAIRGYQTTNGEYVVNGIIGADGENLKKPIVMIINVPPIEAGVSTGEEIAEGKHWQSCVILPKNYTPIHCTTMGNENEIIYYIDSLDTKARIPEQFKTILTEGCTYEVRSDEGQRINYKIPAIFPKATIIDELEVKQQEAKNDSGWWATYNALMLIWTGNIKYTEQFQKCSKETAYKLRGLFPRLIESNLELELELLRRIEGIKNKIDKQKKEDFIEDIKHLIFSLDNREKKDVLKKYSDEIHAGLAKCYSLSPSIFKIEEQEEQQLMEFRKFILGKSYKSDTIREGVLSVGNEYFKHGNYQVAQEIFIDYVETLKTQGKLYNQEKSDKGVDGKALIKAIDSLIIDGKYGEALLIANYALKLFPEGKSFKNRLTVIPALHSASFILELKKGGEIKEYLESKGNKKFLEDMVNHILETIAVLCLYEDKHLCAMAKKLCSVITDILRELEENIQSNEAFKINNECYNVLSNDEQYVEKVKKLFKDDNSDSICSDSIWEEDRKKLEEIRKKVASNRKNTDYRGIATIVDQEMRNCVKNIFQSTLDKQNIILKFIPDFVILELGSMAKRTMCTHSDIEFAIVTAENNGEFQSQQSNNKFFKFLVEQLEMRIINLGETAKLQVCGKYEIGEEEGLSFDHAGIIPFNNKDGGIILCGTVEDMVKNIFLNGESIFANNMINAGYMCGKKELFKSYHDKLSQRPAEDFNNLKEDLLKRIKECISSISKEDLKIGIKEYFLRLPEYLSSWLLISNQKMFNNKVYTRNIHDKINMLHEGEVISNDLSNFLYTFLHFGLAIRNKALVHYGTDKIGDEKRISLEGDDQVVFDAFQQIVPKFLQTINEYIVNVGGDLTNEENVIDINSSLYKRFNILKREMLWNHDIKELNNLNSPSILVEGIGIEKLPISLTDTELSELKNCGKLFSKSKEGIILNIELNPKFATFKRYEYILAEHLFGTEKNFIPENKIIKITFLNNDNSKQVQTIPALISKVYQPLKAIDNSNDDIDNKTFSRLFLFSLLMGYHKLKRENIFLDSTNYPKIMNCEPFYPEYYSSSIFTTALGIRNCSFLMDKMKEDIDMEVLSDFIKLEMSSFIKDWLDIIEKEDSKNQQIFDKEDIEKYAEQGIILTNSISKSILSNIYDYLIKIKNILSQCKDSVDKSHNRILSEVSLRLFSKHFNIISKSNNFEDAEKKLFKEKHFKLPNNFVQKKNLVSLDDLKESRSKSYPINEIQEYFTGRLFNYKTISNNLLTNNPERFYELGHAMKAEVIETLDFDLLNEEQQTNVFSIIKNDPLTSITLKHSKYLKDDDLSAISKRSGNFLSKLILTKCPEITNVSIHSILGYCKNLQEIIITSNGNITHFAPASGRTSLINLFKLDLSGCQNITLLDIGDNNKIQEVFFDNNLVNTILYGGGIIKDKFIIENFSALLDPRKTNAISYKCSTELRLPEFISFVSVARQSNNLTKVDFSCKEFKMTVSNAKTFSEVFDNDKIAEIRLNNSGINDKAVVYMFEALRKKETGLTSFNLANNDITKSGVKAIAEILKDNKSLKEIVLDGNEEIGSEGIIDLCIAMNTNSYLKTLSVNNCRFMEDIETRVVGAGLWSYGVKTNKVRTQVNEDRNKVIINFNNFLENNQTIENLYIGGNMIEDSVLSIIVSKINSNTTLKKLDISNNTIDTKTAVALREMLKTNQTLEYLDLSNNSTANMTGLHIQEMIDKDWEPIIEGLKDNKAIECIKLCNNSLSVLSAQNIVDMLRQNTVLTDLYISNNNLKNEGVRAICDFLINTNSKLKFLEIGYAEITDEAKTLLKNLKLNNNGIGVSIVS